MKREEVKIKLSAVNDKIKFIEEVRDSELVIYATMEKHLPGAGYINEIETIDDLVAAQHIINKYSDVDNSKVVEILGLTDDEVPVVKEVKVMGISVKYWNDDIKKRLGVLRMESKLNKLYHAHAMLTKHLSDDDKFDLDMEGIDNLI